MWMFSLMYVSSFLFVLSNNDWFLIWLGLEINMISFIFLFFKKENKNVECCMKYFIIQSVGSGILICGFYSGVSVFECVGVLVLSYKVGAGPFYYWFPSMCDGVSWGSCIMLMTFQKILPMILMSIFLNVYLLLVGLMSLIVGGVGSFNQKILRKLMAYSSIHHIGWMMMCMFMLEGMWIIYLLGYFMMIFSIFYLFKKEEVVSLDGISKLNLKWGFVLSMLNMGGIPPMFGFFLKWMVFSEMLKVSSGMMILMLLMSVVMFYIYFRVCYMMLIDGAMEMGFISKSNKMLGVESLSLMGMFIGPLLLLI